MASHRCVLCGRTSSRGLRQSDADPAVWMCTAARACLQRHREQRRASAEDPRWRQLQALAIADLHPRDMIVSTRTCSIAYAQSVLDDYDLGDWDWLVHELAAAMDEAAMDAADEWLALQRPGLEGACHLPRPCPCGRWPDFGTGCYYHGPRRCVLTEIAYTHLERYCATSARFAYSAEVWWWNWLDGKTPTLDRGCPVHPDGPVPREVLDRWAVKRDLSLNPSPEDITRYARREWRERRQA